MRISNNLSNIRRKISAFRKFVDLPAIQTPIGSVGLGMLYSYEVTTPSTAESSILRLFIAFIGIILILSYIMTSNDYFDAEIDKQGKWQALAEISKRSAGITVIIFLSFGLLFAWIVSPMFFTLSLAVVLLSTAYSAPPIRYKEVYPFSTLGEVAGAYLLFLTGCSVFAPIGMRALVVSCIPFFTITYLRLRHEIRFVKFDEATGKRTLAVVHGVGTVKLLMRFIIVLNIALSLFLFLIGWLSLIFMFFLLIFLVLSFHRKLLQRIIPKKYMRVLWLTHQVWGFIYFLIILGFILFLNKTPA